MGFDITFHPVSKEELQRYFFDVATTPSLAESRAEEIAPDSADRETLLNLYRDVQRWIDDPKRDDSRFDKTFAFAAAAVAGYIHPFYYSRNGGMLLSGRNEFSDLVTPLPAIAAGVIAKMEDSSRGVYTENYAGGGFFADLSALTEAIRRLEAEPLKVGFIFKRLVAGKSGLDRYFSPEGLRSLKKALVYAGERQLGLLEATDIMVGGTCYSKTSNFRGYD